MKRLIAFAVLALAGAAATSASAATGTVTVNGSVAANCVLSTASNTITLGEMANSITGNYNQVADGKSTTLTGFCNGVGSTMTVAATAISLQGVHSTPTGFTDLVNYTATASLAPAAGGSVSTTYNTGASTAGPAAAASLFSGDITVGLSGSSTPTGKLIAGPYQGIVTVTLTAALGSPPPS